jgi:PAS domain S-box-containing protein
MSASRDAQKESEERLRLFIDYAPAALAMFDREMRYIAVSRRWLQDYGLGGQDIIGLCHYDVFPEIGQAWKDVHRRALAGEVVRAEEDRFERADGSVQWLRWEVRPWRAADGSVGGIVIFTEDISLYKRSEIAKGELAETLRAFRSINRLVVGEKDPRAVLDRACALLMETRHYRSVWAARVDSEGRASLAGQVGLDVELDRFRSCLEEEAWPRCLRRAAEETGPVVIRDPGTECEQCPLSGNMEGRGAFAGALRHAGRTYGFLVATMRKDEAEDPEEQAVFKEAVEEIGLSLYAIEEERARASAVAEAIAGKAKLAAALASISDAVFISDLEGNFLDFNEAFAAFHKFKNKADCAKTLAEYPAFLDVFMEDGSLAPLEMWAVPRALRGEVGSSVVYYLRRKDTGENWVGSYSFAPIRNEEGSIVGSVVVGRDITERKRNEELMAKALREKEILLQELFHRTKNNMLTIIGMMSLRLSARPDSSLADFVEGVSRQIMAMALVHESLYRHKDLSRLDLKDCIAEMANYAIKESSAASRVRLALDTERVPVLFDTAAPLALVLGELLGNALKHAFPGGRSGEIKIGLARVEAGTVELRFSDDGIGMPEGIDESAPGSFGLSLVYSLVQQQLRGTIAMRRSLGTSYSIKFRDDIYEARV